MKHKRIANKRRFFGFVCLVVLVVGLICSCAVQANVSEKNSIAHVVSQGDTVWSIAKQYCPNGQDVRAFAFEITQDNGLEDYIIHSGDRLIINE